MKNNKLAIIWSFSIAVVTILISCFLYNISCEYWSNIFSGIFASAVLALLLSIINYVCDRRKTLEQFYTYARKAAYNFNCFKNDGDLDSSIDSILEMDRFDYVELDNAYRDMSFLFKNASKNKYIYEKIFYPILKTREIVSKNSNLIKMYRNMPNANKSILQSFVKEVANAIIEEGQIENVNEAGERFLMKTIRNKADEDIKNELIGRFYELMYPNLKKERNHAD